jgi:ABC-type enterochelin transport system permease subunit
MYQKTTLLDIATAVVVIVSLLVVLAVGALSFFDVLVP